jgi:thiol:disulfide interchange protein DsbD
MFALLALDECERGAHHVGGSGRFRADVLALRGNLHQDTARPGDTVLAGVHLQMASGWHTYWQNPGASGIATKIDWKLPDGITAGKPEWPLPEKLADKDITTYIYREEAVILVPLKLASTLSPGSFQLTATVLWLECEVQCVPGNAEVQTRGIVAFRMPLKRDHTQAIFEFACHEGNRSLENILSGARVEEARRGAAER